MRFEELKQRRQVAEEVDGSKLTHAERLERLERLRVAADIAEGNVGRRGRTSFVGDLFANTAARDALRDTAEEFQKLSVREAGRGFRGGAREVRASAVARDFGPFRKRRDAE